MVEVATVEKQQALELKPIEGSEVQRVVEVVEGEGEEGSVPYPAPLPAPASSTCGPTPSRWNRTTTSTSPPVAL